MRLSIGLSAPLPDSDLLSHSYSLQPIGPLARFSRAYDYLRSHVIKHETSQLSAQSKHEESPSDEHQVSIGLLLARDGEWIRIAAVTIGSAAETVGINRGDAIVAINGQSTSGKSLSWCYQQLSGEEGSVVEVSVYAETGDQIDYRVIRTRVNVPYVVMLSRPLV